MIRDSESRGGIPRIGQAVLTTRIPQESASSHSLLPSHVYGPGPALSWTTGKAPPSALGQHRSLAAWDSASSLPPLPPQPLRQAASGTACAPVHANHCGLLTAGTRKMCVQGTSLVVQWLRLRTPNVGGPGLIRGQETRSHMHATTKSSPAATKEPVCHN